MVAYSMLFSDESGQAHAVEAVVASGLILTAVLFAIQATVITPFTMATSNQHIENQQQQLAQGVLDNVKFTESPTKNSALKNAILYWSVSERGFHGGTSEGYLGRYPDNNFGDALNETFTNKDIATNIYLTYKRVGGGSATKQYVNMGIPSSSVSTATTTVVLYDDDPVTAPGETGSVAGINGYFAPNVNPTSNVYNVIEVKVVVWRV